MKAIRLERYGDPDVLKLVDMPMPVAGARQLLVRNQAIGLNFLETRMRRGDYSLLIPGGIGFEGAGVVEAVGAGVTGFEPGDRVAYMDDKPGADAEFVAVSADRAVTLPTGVCFETAAASITKGMTAQVLLKKTFPVKGGMRILVWAASGGMGQHLVQWGTYLGARVIAVVGSEAKMARARSLGAEHVLVSSQEDIAKRVRELTEGEGVAVVYDAIGKDSAEASLNSLAPLGMFVNYGSASGHPAPLVTTDLSDKGSLFYTRAVLYTYIRTPALFGETIGDVMEALDRRILNLPAPLRYPLADTARAHTDIASRNTMGSLVLIP